MMVTTVGLKDKGCAESAGVMLQAMLPILGMGHVRLSIDSEDGGSPLLPLIRYMTTHQPSAALHLELVPRHPLLCHMRPLMELRCPYMLARVVLELNALAVLMPPSSI